MLTIKNGDILERIGFSYSKDKRGRKVTTCHYRFESDINSVELNASVACSHQDQFNKNKGRKLALAKLLNNVEHFARSDRAEIWAKYFETRNGKVL